MNAMILAVLAVAVTNQALAQATAKDIECYITEQSVKNGVRTCIWQCRDHSIESVMTPSQFQCPTTLFKRNPRAKAQK